MGGTMSEHTQRDWFFFVIRDIKYAAAYGGIYANSLEKISGIIDCIILFLMSGAFSSFWLWAGHEHLFGCIMLLAAFIQLFTSQFGLRLKAQRVRISSNLLHGLYSNAKCKWFELELKTPDEQAYFKYAELYERLERQVIFIADADIPYIKELAMISNEAAKSQIEADFGCKSN